MLKRFEEESINIIREIYKDIDEIQILYLIRNRSLGGSDLGLNTSKQKLVKGLRDFEYHYYKSIKTPKLLLDKKLLTKKDTFFPLTDFPGIKIKTEPKPFAYEVTPNKEIIKQVIDNLEGYLLGTYNCSVELSEPIQKSKYLQLLRTGEALLFYEDRWVKFCDLELELDEDNRITTNAGKLLSTLIGKKKVDETSCLFSQEYIKEELNLSNKELDNSINHLRRCIKKQRIKSMSPDHKVDIRKPRNSKNVCFINIVQDKDKILEINPSNG